MAHPFLLIAGIVTGIAGIVWSMREKDGPDRKDVDGVEDDQVDNTEELVGREYRLYLGQQESGKTYRVKHADVPEFVERGCYGYICDTQREYGSCGQVFRSFKGYLDYVDRYGRPQVCVCQFGEDPAAYNDVFDEATLNAEPDPDTTTFVVIDEFYEFASAGLWTGPTELRSIIRAGRHQLNGAGTLSMVHLIGIAQYPQDLHRSVWQQAYDIAVGHATGDDFFAWIRKNYEKENLNLVERAKALKPHEWLYIKGKRTGEMLGEIPAP